MRTGVHLEHPIISSLYDALVLRGSWTSAESLLHSLASGGLLASYIQTCQPRARWRRLRGTDANGDMPSARGGHAMCMDAEAGLIYLFGGWDGRRSLDDFWVYDVRSGRWKVISHSAGEEKNGPGPRSCHKMVFDPKSGCIYMLGRLSDRDSPVGDDAAAPLGENNAPASPTALGEHRQREEPRTEPAPTQIGATMGAGVWRGRRSVGVGTNSGPTTPVASRQQDFSSEFYRYRTRGLDQGRWELLDIDTKVTFSTSANVA